MGTNSYPDGVCKAERILKKNSFYNENEYVCLNIGLKTGLHA